MLQMTVFNKSSESYLKVHKIVLIKEAIGPKLEHVACNSVQHSNKEQFEGKYVV